MRLLNLSFLINKVLLIKKSPAVMETIYPFTYDSSYLMFSTWNSPTILLNHLPNQFRDICNNLLVSYTLASQYSITTDYGFN